MDYKIKGWICKDKYFPYPKIMFAALDNKPPRRHECGYWIAQTWGSSTFYLNGTNLVNGTKENAFPDITWEDEPIEAEIIVNRIK